MKFLIAFALIAVAAATPLRPTGVVSEQMLEIQQIVAAIQSPSTDPATAVALEAMLLEALGISAPISPIAIGPAIIAPLPDGGAVTAPAQPSPVIVAPVAPIAPSPVVIGEIPAGQTPLVQIIVNVAGEESNLIVPGGAVDIIEQPHVPGPVNIVDNVVPEPISPVQVVSPVAPGPVNVVDNIVIPVSPVQVAEPVVVSPVQVVDPIVVSPVQVDTPIIPSPVVALPDSLNRLWQFMASKF